MYYSGILRTDFIRLQFSIFFAYGFYLCILKKSINILNTLPKIC